jgi:hypothetical protein
VRKDIARALMVQANTANPLNIKEESMKKIIAIALFSFTIMFLSNNPLHAAGERAYEYVAKVSVTQDNYLHIVPIGNFEKSRHDTCSEISWGRSAWQITDERTKAMMTLATSSLMGMKPVYIYTSGCTGGGTTGYPIVTQIILRARPDF